MACMGGGPSLEQVQAEADHERAMVRMLCLACREMEGRKIPLPSDEMAGWYAGHKAEDAEREAADARDAAAAKLRADTLAAMTDGQLAALGHNDALIARYRERAGR